MHIIGEQRENHGERQPLDGWVLNLPGLGADIIPMSSIDLEHRGDYAKMNGKLVRPYVDVHSLLLDGPNPNSETA